MWYPKKWKNLDLICRLWIGSSNGILKTTDIMLSYLHKFVKMMISVCCSKAKYSWLKILREKLNKRWRIWLSEVCLQGLVSNRPKWQELKALVVSVEGKEIINVSGSGLWFYHSTVATWIAVVVGNYLMWVCQHARTCGRRSDRKNLIILHVLLRKKF